MGRAADRDKGRVSLEKAKIILDGAMQEFLIHGYAGASMDRLAVAAGVSKPTLYNYFQNKEGLFTALIERLAQEKLQAILESQDSQGLQGETEVVLRRIAIKLLNTITGDQQLLAFIRLVIGESGRFPKLARSFVSSLDKPIILALTQHLATRHELLDPEAGARVIFGTLVYFVIIQEILCTEDVLPMEYERLIDTLVSLFSSQSQKSEE
ncbi:TetR/AcrR family transcriptional regulator [Brasilonema bromeliae]|uniref:TetR/AcrR family transcriptional regulator n=1 Tax=Brasilonema bromeliae SPC951 TaxID=385972 RepID=A0ABX1PC32_9CYAN|nr:TetR/AcrR family transcriptional regulator [Brasilonema bromeliae]NMG22035.1 TetR/AcrR family transcriptional regulator [Brasilonema bromeliae SPC951]